MELTEQDKEQAMLASIRMAHSWLARFETDRGAFDSGSITIDNHIDGTQTLTVTMTTSRRDRLVNVRRGKR